MEITLTAELENALQAAAKARGVAPEALAVDALRDRFLRNGTSIQPQDGMGARPALRQPRVRRVTA